jgi:uncharacterized protein YbjT (DUF2867 family)
MKVFVAGATGALGTQLVPLLVANGHDVVGMTRTEAKRDQLRSVGAQPAKLHHLGPVSDLMPTPPSRGHF